MKKALVNGVKVHAKDVTSGTRGTDIWFPDYEVKAHVGRYRQYWVYSDEVPNYPRGYEPESDWHNSWKDAIIDDHCEVICGANNEHRADIKTNEFVIEIQKSRIDGNILLERIEFYRNLTDNRVIWVVNIEKPWKEKRITTKLINRNQFELKWKYKHSWVEEIANTTDANLFLDFNPKSDKLIKTWVHRGVLKSCWVKKTDFFMQYLENSLKPEYTENIEKVLDIFQNLDN